MCGGGEVAHVLLHVYLNRVLSWQMVRVLKGSLLWHCVKERDDSYSCTLGQ